MEILSETNKDKIRKAVKEAELKTSGELVAVIARTSDDYFYIPLLWASFLALSFPMLLWILPWEFSEWQYGIQISVFVLSAMLFQVNAIKMKLIPRKIKNSRANRLAWEQFFAQGLQHTKERTGVLIFVSLAEHYVEVIADKGINDKVKKDAWQNPIDDFVTHVKNGNVTDGFLYAIEDCSTLLTEHFPRAEDDINELPNHLIEI